MSAFRRLPIRLRLTLAFAGVLTTVVAAGGLVLYSEFEGDFDGLIERDLDARLADVSALVLEEPEPGRALSASGVGIAQVYDEGGRLLASTPPSRAPLLTGGQVRRAAREALRVDRVDTRQGSVRVRAGAARSIGDPPLVVAVGEDLGRRDAALERLRELLFIGGPPPPPPPPYARGQVAPPPAGAGGPVPPRP